MGRVDVTKVRRAGERQARTPRGRDLRHRAQALASRRAGRRTRKPPLTTVTAAEQFAHTLRMDAPALTTTSVTIMVLATRTPMTGIGTTLESGSADQGARYARANRGRRG